MNATSQRRTVYLVLLISLLFHAGLIIFFASVHFDPVFFDHNPVHVIDLQEQEKFDYEPPVEWVEALAGGGGIPVIAQSNDTSDTESEMKKNEESEHQEAPQKSVYAPTVMQVEETPEKQEQKSEQLAKQEPLVQEDAHEPPMPTQLVEHVPVTVPHNPAAKKEPVEQQQPPVQKKGAPQAVMAASTPQQKQLTLAQLTQGFMDHIQGDGQHAVHMYGKKQGVMTEEQLRHERYMQKIQACWNNSCSIHRNHKPTTDQEETTSVIYFALNRDGSLAHLELIESCGVRTIDDFVLFMFKDASTSFPPIPTYFKSELYRMTCNISMIHKERQQRPLFTMR